MKKSDSRKARSTSEQVAAVSLGTKHRKRLSKAAESYFKSLNSEAAAEENDIARNLMSAAEDLDFGKEF